MWVLTYVLNEYIVTPPPSCGQCPLRQRGTHTIFHDDLDASCSLCFKNIAALINLHADSEVSGLARPLWIPSDLGCEREIAQWLWGHGAELKVRFELRASLGSCVSALSSPCLHPVVISEAQSPLAGLDGIGDSDPQGTAPSGIWAHPIGKAAMVFCQPEE